MTDKDLLTLAANAAGIDARRLPDAWPNRFDDDLWNPLTDDGDALRLAVKLGIDISFGIFASQINAEIYDWVEEEVKAEVHEGGRDDPYAATRRAIVRAAAEIGKATV